MKPQLKRHMLKAGKWAGLVLLSLIIFSLIQVSLLRIVNPPFSAVMLWDWLGCGADFSIRVNWADRKELSPHLVRAVLAAEDQRFFEHHGFDWVELKKAVDERFDGGRLRGASTITMQTARNMFLWQGRSWLRKGLEAYYAVLLELLLPKERILEIYLNIAQWGRGKYGARAASNHYFGRPPSRLSKSQAARLAVVLPSPIKMSPLKSTKYMVKRRDFVLRQMRNMVLKDWNP